MRYTYVHGCRDATQRLRKYVSHIPHLDTDIFNGWGKLQSGSSFDELSKEEQQKVGRLGQLVDQFVAAYTYVFITHMLNFSFHPIFKAYIDAICVLGKTFRYPEQGPVGLLTDKKALHIQASGGVYSVGPAAEMEMGHRYLATIMKFFGIP